MGSVKTVGIIGMGYVGLTLAVIMAKKGFAVHGVEINPEVVRDLRAGIPHFREKGLAPLLAQQQRAGNLIISDALPEAPLDAYIISVGTPLVKETQEPNIKYIDNSVAYVAKHMAKGALVVLRSTVPVGLSRETVLPALERYSGLKAGADFSFVFAPERTIEGNALAELETNSQVLGGIDAHSVTVAADMFRKLTATIVIVSSIEAAEMIKIMDNSYRDVRFAYANEIAMVCEKLNLDATELIKAANTHYPRNNIPVPSPGVGGACLSKDPHILRYFSKKAGHDPQLIGHARRINERIPAHIVDRITAKLASHGKDIRKAKVLVVGFAFKGQPETSDLRDSTTLWLLDALREHTQDIYGYDPVVSASEIAKLGVKPVDIEAGAAGADVVLFMNNHPSYYDIDPSGIIELMDKPGVFYDAWRMFPSTAFDDTGAHYMGVGK